MTASRLILLCLWSLFLASCVCGHRSTGATDASRPDAAITDAAIEAAVRDALPDIDAFACTSTDALPGSTVVLPTHESPANLAGLSFFHPYVVYSEHRFDLEIEKQYDIFLFDLMTLQEQRLTDNLWAEMLPVIWGQTIIWKDNRFYSPPENRKMDMYSYDIPTGVLTQLTDDAWPNFPIAMSSSHLLYSSCEDVPPPCSSWNLTLRNLQTDEQRLLAEHWRAAEGDSLSETHVTWVARETDQGSNRDVYIHDIEANLTRRLDSTVQGYQYITSVWEDKVVWMDSRNWPVWPPAYDIYFYDIGKDEERALTLDIEDQCAPRIWKNLVVWTDFTRTGYWCEDRGYAPSDLIIHDLDTEVRRRIFDCPEFRGLYYFKYGYMLYYHRTGTYATYYVMDLQEAGIIDSDNHVIPAPEQDP